MTRLTFPEPAADLLARFEFGERQVEVLGEVLTPATGQELTELTCVQPSRRRRIATPSADPATMAPSVQRRRCVSVRACCSPSLAMAV